MREVETNVLPSSEDRLHSTEEFAIVERVARISSSVYGAKPDYTRLATELEQAISFDVFGIILLQHDRKAVRVTICQRDNSLSENFQGLWVPHYSQHPFADSMLEQLLDSSTLIVKEYPHGLDGPPATTGDALSKYPHVRSTCIVPLRTKERVLGSLELGSTLPETYTKPRVQRVISAVAQVLATAIERTQLEGSAEIQNRQRQALKDVSRALTSKMDLGSILAHITDGVAKALNVASAIVTLNSRSSRLHLDAQTGLNATVLNEVVQSEAALTDQCILGSTLRHRQSYISNDIEHDEQFPASHALSTALALRSILTYPLLIDNVVYGVLLLGSQEPGGFTPLKADIVALFATQATIAIHNGLLLEAARQRRRFQDTIEQLDRTFSFHPTSLQDEYALLAHVREEAQRTFGVSLSSILRLISDNLLTDNEPSVQTYNNQQNEDTSNSSPAQEIQRKDLLFLLSNGISSTNSEERESLARDALSHLTQTTEAALARTGVVSELSKLLIQLQQPPNSIKDAWFVTDVDGICLYMNPVAELFCGSHFIDNEHMPILDIFASVLLRIRNRKEVQRYLQDLTSNNRYRQTLRFTVALETLEELSGSAELQDRVVEKNVTPKNDNYEQGRSNALLRTMLRENAPSDTHYQCISHALHDSQGHITAYALQICDITTQVRDEKNKSALLSSVSHDLRTPLTTIKAAVTGLLQKDIPWDEQMRQEMLEDIDVETDHLTVLVNSLVEMSRIEMGALLLEKEWCDIVEVINEVLARTKRVLGERKVQLHALAELPLLYIDRVQIGRVLYNLIENAARYSSEQSEVTIDVDIVSEGAIPTMARISLLDEGRGIPQHEHERIFKAFYGLHSHGSGLGLAICKGIIEAHQGQIWVENAEKGSCFIFTLPVEASLTR